MQILQAAQQFEAYIKFEKRYSQHTVRAYSDDIAQFTSFAADEFEILDTNDVTSQVIRSWLASLKNDADLTAKSIHRKISSLKSLYKYLQKNGLSKQSPLTQIILPKLKKTLPQFVSKQDIASITDIEKELTMFPNNWVGNTQKLLILLFYSTGMRLSELINLKENYIDEHTNTLKVLGKGNKERMIPCDKTLINSLLFYKTEKRRLLETFDNTVLFVLENGKKLYPKWVYNSVHKYLNLATTIDKKSPHVLRHTFATHLLNEGAELNAVKELLGHSSLASTQVYTHNTIEKLKEVYKKAHPKGE